MLSRSVGLHKTWGFLIDRACLGVCSFFEIRVDKRVRTYIYVILLIAVVRDVSPSSCPSAVSVRPLGCVSRSGDGPRGTN